MLIPCPGNRERYTPSLWNSSRMRGRGSKKRHDNAEIFATRYSQSLSAAHPEYTPEEFRAALFERIYGYRNPKITQAESASSAPFDCTRGLELAEG